MIKYIKVSNNLYRNQSTATCTRCQNHKYESTILWLKNKKNVKQFASNNTTRIVDSDNATGSQVS